jgi:flagellar assembly protein FliH
LQKATGREFEFLKAVKFEGDEAVTEGGCILETNYGEIDSRVEQRVEKLWEALVEAIPKVKDKVAS